MGGETHQQGQQKEHPTLKDREQRADDPENQKNDSQRNADDVGSGLPVQSETSVLMLAERLLELRHDLSNGAASANSFDDARHQVA